MKTAKISYANNLWHRYAVCILAFLVITLSPAYASQVTSGVSFAQVSFTGSNPPEMYSHYGQISVDFNMLYGEGYINVERYANGKAAGWVVKNLPVISGSILPGYSTMFDLVASGYQSTFSAYVDFSPTALANDTSLKGQAALRYQLGQAEYPLLAPLAASNKNLYFDTANFEAECGGMPPKRPLHFIIPSAMSFDFPAPTGGADVECFVNATAKVLGGSDFEEFDAALKLTCDPMTFWVNCGPIPSGVIHFYGSATTGIPAGTRFTFNVQKAYDLRRYQLRFGYAW